MTEEFRPNDTMAMRIKRKSQVSRPTRESIGGGSGLGVSTVLLWLAGVAGLDLPNEIAGILGGMITTAVSAVVRKQLMKDTR